jgi:uncharacterized protein YndB with AHSA1/START domain
MTLDKITIQAEVAVEKSKLWDYYTLPEHIINWNFADPSWHCPRASNNMIIGGEYNARMEAKDGSFGFDFIAYYSEINPGENFIYEFAGRVVSVSFSEIESEKTLITIIFDPETENPIDLQRNGWQMILNNFKNYAEGIN